MSSPPPQALEEFLAQCQQRTNASLESALQLNLPSKQLNEAMRYACLNGGKRIRPVLSYGAIAAVGGDLQLADNAACAVEMIHSYSLVHDDLPAMDDDDLRRGKPSLHKAYDEATAILVGDGLQALAFQVLASANPEIDTDKQLSMLQLLAEAAGAPGMVVGQALDFEAVGKPLTLPDLENLHRLKTGALIKASVLLGAMSKPDVEDSQLQALSDYSLHIGLAFQVQDDILDVTSDTETLGKPQGSDHRLNKPTYVSLLGLEAARDKASQLTDAAVDALADFPASADRLRELAGYIVSRKH